MRTSGVSRRLSLAARIALCIAFGLVLMSHMAHAEAGKASALPAQEWRTYSDSRFGYSLDYPASWAVTPRSEKGVGGVLQLRAPRAATGGMPFEAPQLKVEVGLYLSERDPSASLTTWSRQYARAASAFPADQIRTISEQETMLREDMTYKQVAVSP